jgi:2-amino-4-hydroxy-6-hydroxymethyldihydropteridine diphosphokinase
MTASRASAAPIGDAAVVDALAYIGLGANLGDRERALTSAIDAIARLPSTVGLRVSPWYASVSMGASGPDYLNAVAEVRTTLAPPALLDALLAIEAAHGRQRSHRNAPRTLDLDLLVYGDRVLRTATLTVPHPRLHERAFVLRPLADLAPALALPTLGPIAGLLAAVADQRLDKL